MGMVIDRGLLKPARPPAWLSFARLYRSHTFFRSCLDFSVIGFFVYLFVAPLPLPFLSQATSGVFADTTATPPAPGVSQLVRVPASPTMASVSSALTAPRPAATRSEKIARERFAFSEPEIRYDLNRAADFIEAGQGAAARELLEASKDANDPNVLHLLGFANNLEAKPGHIQRGYAYQLKAAELGQAEAMKQVGDYIRLGHVGEANLAKALEWYTRGASLGSGAAATSAGRAYYNGWSVPIDLEKAFGYYAQGAATEDVWGMRNYGAMMLEGEGGKKDPERGRWWIEKSAKMGLPDAQILLATLWRRGIGGPKDIEQFLSLARQASYTGLAEADYQLASFYYQPDDGRAPSFTSAADHFSKAAAKGHSKAQYGLGVLYGNGQGVTRDVVQAHMYLTLAANSGVENAQKELAALVQQMSAAEIDKGQKLALEWKGGGAVEASASQHMPSQTAQDAPFSKSSVGPEDRVDRRWFARSHASIVPQLDLATDLLEQNQATRARQVLDATGKPDDANVVFLSAAIVNAQKAPGYFEASFALMKRAADLGHPDAMNQMGQYLRRGLGTAPDLDLAVGWYERAAAAGSGLGATNVGRAHLKGWGRPVNPTLALPYFLKGAEWGDRYAMLDYGTMVGQGIGTKADPVRGRQWVERSAKAGLADAQFALGNLALKGRGGPQSFDEFLKWMSAAADQNFAQAHVALADFYLNAPDGRPADVSLFAEHLHRAADLGDGQAELGLGATYEMGGGSIEKNPVLALSYYLRALKHGQKGAQPFVDSLRSRMNPADIGKAEQLASASN